MTARILLVRHAAHDEIGRVLSGRVTDVPLNATGEAEAARLATAIRGRGVVRLLTSPQRRTHQTADMLAMALGCAVEVENALDEVDFGAWAGRDFATLATDPAWHHWNQARDRAPTPGGETMAAAAGRITRFLDHAAADANGGALLCVSHCDMIRAAVAHYLGLGLDRMLAFDIDPASITTLEIGDHGGRVLRMNEGF
ncbi:MAG TPA: histidine phosphatase family protein [Sphingomonas sp.]|jgi:broad specificity phosphatase PhoE|uniref:histidine phosphatase family protein n=1 Tax=Sphingomonas sp. TaxID=28214 RepID=UPI002EDB4284